MHPHMQVIWGNIWKHTEEKNHTKTTNENTIPLRWTIWRKKIDSLVKYLKLEVFTPFGCWGRVTHANALCTQPSVFWRVNIKKVSGRNSKSFRKKYIIFIMITIVIIVIIIIKMMTMKTERFWNGFHSGGRRCPPKNTNGQSYLTLFYFLIMMMIVIMLSS